MNPTARSKQWGEKKGYSICTVEKYNSFIKQRFDAFGFGDLLVLDGKYGAALWQVTTTENINARIDKIKEIEYAKTWLLANNRIFVHGWGKRGERGKRKLWTLKCYEIVLSNGRLEAIEKNFDGTDDF